MISLKSLKAASPLVLAMLIAACGGGGGGGGGSSVANPTPAPPPPPPPPDPSASAVHLNQVGFQPMSAKSAIVVTNETGALDWSLLDAGGTEVMSGQTSVFGRNAGSDENVHQIDFSSYVTPGTGYHIEVLDAESHPFDIDAAVYTQMKFDALAFYYHQRSGIAIEEQYVGAELARPIAHSPDAGPCYGPLDFRGNDWGGCGYTLDVTKGWYDAGDHGKYVVNSGISVWTLMNYYEQVQGKPAAKAAFDGWSLQIPENGNGVHDLLDEIRWNLEFMLAMQVPDGTTLTLPLGNQYGSENSLTFTAVDASGMVHHKFHDEYWTGIPTAPHEDPADRFLSYPSTAATLNLAATAAQCARIWETIDPAFSARCLSAAEKAYAAAERVPDALAYDVIDGGGGGYGDNNLADEFYWAAAELFVTTGDAAYDSDMRASSLFLYAPEGNPSASGDISWGSVHALGTISLAVVPSTLPAGDVDAARQAIIDSADAYAAQTAGEGYRIAFGRGYTWGSNSDIGNRAIILALAADFTGDDAYREEVVNLVDYLLGRNPLDQSYISGYGERPMVNPHHRFWAHSVNASYPEPPAGVVAGGSNSQSPADPVAQALAASCHPQTCYVDDIDAYSLNEVTINWNAPFFWVTAWLDE